MSGRSNGKQLILSAFFVFAAGVVLAGPAESADARPSAKAAHTSAAARHPRGSYTQTTQRQRTANGHTTKTVRTDAQGRASRRDAMVTNDKAAGTREKDVTYTGRNGSTRTADTVTQRTDTGYTRDTTYTDRNGNTATREADVTIDPATATKTRDVTYTGRDGEVRTVDDDLTRTANGFDRSTIVSGANGTTTREAAVSRDADTHTTTKTVTVDHTAAAQ